MLCRTAPPVALMHDNFSHRRAQDFAPVVPESAWKIHSVSTTRSLRFECSFAALRCCKYRAARPSLATDRFRRRGARDTYQVRKRPLPAGASAPARSAIDSAKTGHVMCLTARDRCSATDHRWIAHGLAYPVTASAEVHRASDISVGGCAICVALCALSCYSLSMLKNSFP